MDATDKSMLSFEKIENEVHAEFGMGKQQNHKSRNNRPQKNFPGMDDADTVPSSLTDSGHFDAGGDTPRLSVSTGSTIGSARIFDENIGGGMKKPTLVKPPEKGDRGEQQRTAGGNGAGVPLRQLQHQSKSQERQTEKRQQLEQQKEATAVEKNGEGPTAEDVAREYAVRDQRDQDLAAFLAAKTRERDQRLAESTKNWVEQAPSVVVVGEEQESSSKRGATVNKENEGGLRRPLPSLSPMNTTESLSATLRFQLPRVQRLFPIIREDEKKLQFHQPLDQSTPLGGGGGGFAHPSKRSTIKQPSLSPIQSSHGHGSRGGGDRGQVNVPRVRRLMGQLSDLIQLLDVQRKNLKDVQGRYYAKQSEALEKAWGHYHTKTEELNAKHCKEMAKVAEIRAGIAREKDSQSVKRFTEKQKDLEEKISKSEGRERQAHMKLSELRTKLTEFEGQNRALTESSEKYRDDLKKLNERLLKSEMSNAQLRTQIKALQQQLQNPAPQTFQQQQPLRAATPARGPSLLNPPPPSTQNNYERNPSSSSFSFTSAANNSFQQQQQPELVFHQQGESMVASSSSSVFRAGGNNNSLNNTGNRVRTFSGSGTLLPLPVAGNNYVSRRNNGGNNGTQMEATKFHLTDRGKEYTFSNATQSTVFTVLNCDCVLYEYAPSGDFRWLARSPCNVQVYYWESREVYEVLTPSKNTTIRFFTTGQLEIDWGEGNGATVGGRSIVFPNATRSEMFFYQGVPCLERFESYIGAAARGGQLRGTRWVGDEGTEFVTGIAQMSAQNIGTRAERYCEVDAHDVLNVYGGDEFKLAYVDNEGKRTVKLVFPGACVDLVFCTENYFEARHVERRASDGRKFKQMCYRRGHCTHRREN